jgi:hypothetical protein
LGVTEEEFGMLKAAFDKQKDNIHSPEDFKDMLGQMLSMIAYGMPEAMDPDQAMMMGVMKMLEPVKMALEEEYPEMDESNAPLVVDAVLGRLENAFGSAPPELMEAIREALTSVGSYDELWNQFSQAYIRIAKESHKESNEPELRELPDVEELAMEIMRSQEFRGILSQDLNRFVQNNQMEGLEDLIDTATM